jgi:hypothetical protein
MPASQYTIERGRRSLLSTSKSCSLRIREEGHADKVLRHLHDGGVDSGNLFCNFRLGLDRDSTVLTNHGIERDLYDSCGVGRGTKERSSNREERRFHTTRAKLPFFSLSVKLKVNTIAFLSHDLVVLLDANEIVRNIHDAYQHSYFKARPYSLLITGPLGLRCAHPKAAPRFRYAATLPRDYVAGPDARWMPRTKALHEVLEIPVY